MRTIDRYLLREFLPPFLIALIVFTFLLDIMPMLEVLSQFLAKGVAPRTVAHVVLLLLPQALGLTLPIAFLTGLLMALGRWSGDREALALQACGVSPLRLLRSVLVAAAGTGLVTLYVMVWLLPQCNQKFQEVAWNLLSQQTEQDIKPGVFYEGFPGKVLYVQSASPTEGWFGVMVADTSQVGRPSVALAERGRVFLNRDARQVVLSLSEATQYAPGADAQVYDTTRTLSSQPLTFTIAANDVFSSPNHGLPEMSIAELRQMIAAEARVGSSGRNAYFFWQQMFSFPVACLVFAVVGLPIGLHTRKEGKLAGLVIGLAIVLVYYALMKFAESLVMGNRLPAIWARWVPNLALAPIGIAALWWRQLAVGSRERLFPAWLVAPRRSPERRDGSARAGTEFLAGNWRLPGLRLLDRYVGRVYLRIAVLAFFGLLTLNYLAAALDMSNKIFKGWATTSMLFDYLWYATPQFITYVVPMATLLAVLGTIGSLTRANELTVMRACGVSLYRAVWPVLFWAGVWSLLLFGLQELVVAQSNRRALELRDEIRNGAPVHRVSIDNRHWLAGKGGEVYYYLSFTNQGEPRLAGLSIFETASRPFQLRSHTYAAGAVYRDGAWRGENGWTQAFDPVTGNSVRESFTSHNLALPPPDRFGASYVDTDLLTFQQLRAQIDQLAASGFNITDQRVRLQTKLAFPLVAVVMTLLGIPFGMSTGRRGALYGVGLAMLLAVAYWLLSFVFIAAGSAGVLPPALAAWATNILFVTAAGVMVLTVRT